MMNEEWLGGGTCPLCGMPGGASICDDCHEHGDGPDECPHCFGTGTIVTKVVYREYGGSGTQVDYTEEACGYCQ